MIVSTGTRVAAGAGSRVRTGFVRGRRGVGESERRWEETQQTQHAEREENVAVPTHWLGVYNRRCVCVGGENGRVCGWVCQLRMSTDTHWVINASIRTDECV